MNEKDEEIIVTSKKRSIKLKLTIFSLVFILGFGAYLYFWYQSTNQIRLESLALIEKVSNLEEIKKNINSENLRCKDYIVKKEGEFAGFEYCKQFINWSDPILSTK